MINCFHGANAFLDGLDVPHGFSVGGDSSSHDGGCITITFEFSHVLEMQSDQSALVENGAFRRVGALVDLEFDVAQQPGVFYGSAGHHDAGAFGVFDHSGCVIGAGDVSVADYGNPVDGGDDFGDPVEIDFAFEAHLRRSAVNRDELHPHGFELAGELRCGDVIAIPAESEFAGHGEVD